MFKVFAAPNAFIRFALPFIKLALAVDTLKSPPSINMSPSTSRLLLILVVPDAEPISKTVAAVANVTVVAFAGKILNELAVVKISPPLIMASPETVKFPFSTLAPLAFKLNFSDPFKTIFNWSDEFSYTI